MDARTAGSVVWLRRRALTPTGDRAGYLPAWLTGCAANALPSWGGVGAAPQQGAARVAAQATAWRTP